MPVDPSMVDAMLGTFRNMLQECRDKELTGESMDKMVATLQRMEDLSQETDDIGTYSAKLMTEGLFNEFSKHYGSALAEAASSGSSTDPDSYDDGGLLEQSLNAYRDALKRLEEEVFASKVETGAAGYELGKVIDKRAMTQPIKDVIALGESGVNYPTFLRLMIENNLDKAMDGSVTQREALVYDIEWAETCYVPLPEKEMRYKILEKFDELATKSKIGMADSFEFQLARIEIEHHYDPARAKWKAITRRWEQMLDVVDYWIDSYCSFAPYVDPWKMAHDPQRAVRRTQDCNPGELKVREKIFADYFGLTWDDIFTHPTYLNEHEAYHLDYSDERIEFLKEVYLVCKPFQHPPQELIQRAEEMYKRKGNPNRHIPHQRIVTMYDKRFGEGAYAKDIGQ